eukprot:1125887-Ditylum_brightwellii.AAC.1
MAGRKRGEQSSAKENKTSWMARLKKVADLDSGIVSACGEKVSWILRWSGQKVSSIKFAPI